MQLRITHAQALAPSRAIPHSGSNGNSYCFSNVSANSPAHQRSIVPANLCTHKRTHPLAVECSNDQAHHQRTHKLSFVGADVASNSNTYCFTQWQPNL